MSDFITSGYSAVSIPICANMQYTSLSGDGYLSGAALTLWNKDISIGKIGIRIPYDYAFTSGGQRIGIGVSGDPYKFGYFETATSAQIVDTGEWRDFIYSENMYSDQYEYFTSPESILSYTTGVTISTGTDSLSDHYYGQYEVRIFFDQVSYVNGGVGYYPRVSYNSSVNDILQYNFTNDSYVFQGSLGAYQQYGSSVQNNQYMWIGGGDGNSDGTPDIDVIYRLSLSNFTGTASPRTTLTEDVFLLSSTENRNSGIGYWFGGITSTSGANEIQKMDFATETQSDTGANLANSCGEHYTVTNPEVWTYAWTLGGGSWVGAEQSYSDEVYKYTYSTNTAGSSPQLALYTGIEYFGCAYNTTSVWSLGGWTSTAGDKSAIQKFDFANDTGTASAIASLPIAARFSAPVMDTSYDKCYCILPTENIMTVLNTTNETMYIKQYMYTHNILYGFLATGLGK